MKKYDETFEGFLKALPEIQKEAARILGAPVKILVVGKDAKLPPGGLVLYDRDNKPEDSNP